MLLSVTDRVPSVAAVLFSVRDREPSVTDREPSVTGRGFRSVGFFTVRCRAVFSTYSFPAQFPVSSVLFSGPGVGAFDSFPWRILFVGNVHILTNCSVRLAWEHDAASRALPKTVSPALLTFISSLLFKDLNLLSEMPMPSCRSAERRLLFCGLRRRYSS